jgi:hypothetical protein
LRAHLPTAEQLRVREPMLFLEIGASAIRLDHVHICSFATMLPFRCTG